MYTYKIKNITVVDGDTIKGEVDLGFRIHTHNNFRLFGINCAEIRGEERPDGLIAKQFAIDFLSTQEEFTIRVHGKDKYGRWLASVYADSGLVLNEELLLAGLATKYMY